MMDKAKEFLKLIQLKNQKRVIKKKQNEINKEYESEGLTDVVLEKQVEVNKLRHEFDIPDEDHLVDEFVQ